MMSHNEATAYSDPGEAFLRDYKERNPLYFQEEQRAERSASRDEQGMPVTRSPLGLDPDRPGYYRDAGGSEKRLPTAAIPESGMGLARPELKTGDATEGQQLAAGMEQASMAGMGVPLIGSLKYTDSEGNKRTEPFGVFRPKEHQRHSREGMNTSATQDLNRGERGPGGMTREEFESLSDDEKFERAAVPAFREAAGKPQGLSRVFAGFADYVTGDRYDYDQRGHGNPELRSALDRGFREEHGRAPNEWEAEELDVISSPAQRSMMGF